MLPREVRSDGEDVACPPAVRIAAPLIDLQSHSIVSDGELEPAAVARAAAAAGVTVMSLTDHDAVSGVGQASAAAVEAGIQNVPAIEMSCVHAYSDDLHVCGYWVDVEAMEPACERAQGARVERAGEIVARLRDFGFDLTLEDAIAEAGDAVSIGRPHIARAAGAGENLGPFFDEYLVPGAKAFVARSWPTAEEAIELIHGAGGAAVVAHPFWDVSTPDQVDDLIVSLTASVGLEGVEAFYPSHNADQTRHCLELCRRLGLTATGSSDFHGPDHKTFSRFGAYQTFDLGEPEVPAKP